MPLALEQMDISYSLWIRSSKTEIVTPDEAEVKKAMGLMQPVVKEWLDTAGPHGKEVLRIASRYAKGPSSGVIRDMASSSRRAPARGRAGCRTGPATSPASSCSPSSRSPWRRWCRATC